MKKINKISNHIILGILFVFLLGSINSVVYGWSNNDEAAAQLGTIHQSTSQDGHTQLSDLNSLDKVCKYLIEVEEEVEEENAETYASVPFQIYPSFDNELLPSYIKSISNLPHPKRYLLFHHLKIDC